MAGFTLLEMLVAMALFTLVLSSFGVLFLKLQKTNAVIDRAERSENVEIVRRFLQHSLEGSRAYISVSDEGRRHVLFSGEPARLAFVVVAPGGHEVGGLYLTTVWLDAEGHLLVRRQPQGWGNHSSSEAEELLDDVEALSFSYFPCPARDPPGGGTRRWTKTDQLPFMIAIMVKFRDGDPRTWRKLSVFLPAAACSTAM